MFATRWNAKLLTFVSPVLDPQALDTPLFLWQDLWAHPFPPYQLLAKVLTKLCHFNA